MQKNLLCFLKGAVERGISFRKGNLCSVHGYCNSNWGLDRIYPKLVTSHMFMHANGPFCWRSKKQDVLAQNTAETEYIALLFAVREVLKIKKLNWMEKTMNIIFNICNKQDIHGCTAPSRDNIVNDRSSYIDVEYHLLIDNIKKGTVSVEYVPISDMTADALTNALSRDKFQRLVLRMGNKWWNIF